MKTTKGKRATAIALACVLVVAAVIAAVAYNARLENYLAIYLMADDTGVGVHTAVSS